METIKVYLDNMFLNIPDSEQVRRVKAELYDMMEDKYHELTEMGKPENEAVGIVISEFGNLEELKEELGLDGASADNTTRQGFKFRKKESAQDAGQKTESRTLSFDEVEEYLLEMPRVAVSMGLGVLLCVCSPATLIAMSARGNAGIAIGLVMLFILVSAGVVLFILASMKQKRFDVLKQNIFNLEPETEQFVKDEKEAGRQWFIWQLVAGVGLCILSPVPLMVSSIMELPEQVILMAVGLLLILVGIGCFLIVRASIQQDMYKVLLQEEEYSKRKKKIKKRMDLLDSLYWTVVLTLYLMWSFYSENWGITWVIWMLAGVFYPVVQRVWSQGKS